MRELGLREWTAIAALVFGVLLGFVFLDPASGGSEAPLPLRYGDTPTPIPTATPTPVPPAPLPQLQGWTITFASIANGAESAENPRVLPGIDFTFDQAPFPDYRDNSWKLTATTSLSLPEGSSILPLRYDAAIRVFVNDREVIARPEPPNGPEDLQVTFSHEAGRIDIRIEALDDGGPFVLQYLGE